MRVSHSTMDEAYILRTTEKKEKRKKNAYNSRTEGLLNIGIYLNIQQLVDVTIPYQELGPLL